MTQPTVSSTEGQQLVSAPGQGPIPQPATSIADYITAPAFSLHLPSGIVSKWYGIVGFNVPMDTL